MAPYSIVCSTDDWSFIRKIIWPLWRFINTLFQNVAIVRILLFDDAVRLPVALYRGVKEVLIKYLFYLVEVAIWYFKPIFIFVIV